MYYLVARAGLCVCIIGLMLWSFVVDLLCGCLLGVVLFGVDFISVVILFGLVNCFTVWGLLWMLFSLICVFLGAVLVGLGCLWWLLPLSFVLAVVFACDWWWSI